MHDLPPVKVPRIARPQSKTKIAPFAIGLGLIGTAVFASLSSNRAEREEIATQLPPLKATTMAAPSSPSPAALAQSEPIKPNLIPLTSAPQPLATATVPLTRPQFVGTPPSDSGAASRMTAAERARARLTAPTLIVDLPPPRNETDTPRPTPMSYDGGLPAAALMHRASMQDPTTAAIVAAGPAPGAIAASPVGIMPAPANDASAPSLSSDSAKNDLNGNERFANRTGTKETEVVRAQRLPNQESLVAQGTIIGAVMETALNSDLPGYARAVVTRDVLSFDGSQVLIPAGSHVIGEYNSGVAQGASRIFIVWNRLIRPDGVVVALASPAVDDLGRGGLGGKVNRHFFQRYGGAILLSVLTGGFGVLAQSVSKGSTVVVSNSTEATSLAGQATQTRDIAPTIKTPQGAQVRIFVARDLDFSGVGPAI